MNYDEFLKKEAQIQTRSAAEQKAFYAECLEHEQAPSAIVVHASYLYGALFFWEGNFRKTIDLVEPVVMNYQSFSFSKKLIGCFNLLATAMHCETEYVEARFVYGLALQLAQEHQAKGLYAREYNNIASVYVMEQSYKDALYYLELAEQVLPDSEEPMGAFIYLNKTVALRKLSRLPEALQAYETAVDDYTASEILPDDTLLCGLSLYYGLGDLKKYEEIKQQTLARLNDMHASEAMETCQNLFECGMDAGDEALVADIFRTMDRYMETHPTEIKVGRTMAELKYAYAEKKSDTEGMLKALRIEKEYEDRVVAQIEHDRVNSLEKYFQITTELQKAVESKEKASQAKTQFLSSVSHDIRTPLNGIIGLLKVNETHADDAQLIRKNRRKMQVAADHLLSLVNDVLDMNKIEDGNVVLSHEVVDFSELYRELMSIIEPAATESGINVYFEQKTSAGTPYVYGSPKHLRRIFLNIYGNCIKYNRFGGSVTTIVEILHATETACTYRWTISDTGIGMSKDFLEHIFEPFVQEKNDARSTYHGSGLGMSIAKGLIEQMGGTITVSSVEGKGSTFVVTIPFEISPAPEPHLQQQTPRASIQGYHLLLVEDNDLNADIAQILLTDEGADVTLARDGKQALDLFAQSRPGAFDAILMDVMMPVMDGLTATRAIRSLHHPNARTIPILAMTANAYAEDAKACLEAGMNAHLGKPLDMDKVVAAIAEYCSK